MKRAFSIGADKRENFKNFAADRTDRVLQALRVLSNCGSRANYEPTPGEIDAIENVLLAQVEATIADLRNGKSTDGRAKFTLASK